MHSLTYILIQTSGNRASTHCIFIQSRTFAFKMRMSIQLFHLLIVASRTMPHQTEWMNWMLRSINHWLFLWDRTWDIQSLSCSETDQSIHDVNMNGRHSEWSKKWGFASKLIGTARFWRLSRRSCGTTRMTSSERLWGKLTPTTNHCATSLIRGISIIGELADETQSNQSMLQPTSPIRQTENCWDLFKAGPMWMEAASHCCEIERLGRMFFQNQKNKNQFAYRLAWIHLSSMRFI